MIKSKWNEEKIFNELEILIKQNNRFPSAKFLQNSGRWDLFRAIANFGGFTFFRKKLKYEITPHGYWKENYKIEIQKIVNKLGRFPSNKELKTESEGLFDFVFRNKLLNTLRMKYKYKPKIKPARFWHDFDNLKDWLIDNFGELIQSGIFPTTDMIVGVKGGRCIANDVIRRHGGFLKVSKLMNCKPQTGFFAPDGHYLDSKLELIVDWYLWSRNIPHKIHGLIAENKRYKYDFKLGNCFVEVWGLNGRKSYDDSRLIKEALYKSQGQTLISIEGNLFQKSFMEIEKSLDKIFNEYGFNIIKQKAKYKIDDVVSRGRGYWTFNNTMQELKVVVDDISQFPSVSYLRKIGKYQIQKSMQKYGGQNKFRALLGFPLVKTKKKDLI